MDQTREAPIGGRALAWMSGLANRTAPWILAVAVFGLSLASPQDFLGFGRSWTNPGVVAVAVFSGGATWMARRRRWPLFVVAAASWLALLLWPAPLVASYYAGTSLRRRQLAVYTVASVAAVVAASLIGDAVGGARDRATSSGNPPLYLAWLLGIPLVVGLWVRARREVVTGLRERAERLEREQAARTDQARSAERARLAREMHDVVAHRVSLMVLHAGALEVNPPDPRTAEAAALIRATGREALTNLRDVLGVLRPSDDGSGTATGAGERVLGPQPVLADLDTLLDASRAAGIPVRRHDEGAPRTLPDMVQRTAYRVVQEALTNVHKHAPGAATEVTLRYAAGALDLSVENGPPPGRHDAMPGSGLGLVGVRERVVLLGGNLEAGARGDGGFTLRALLPTEREEAA